MCPSVTDLDASREEDPESALAAYLLLEPALVAEDSARLGWVLDQFEGKPLDRVADFLAAIERDGTPAQRRQVQSFRAAQLYNDGKTREAEQLWRVTVEEGQNDRDRWWLCAANNLALIFMRRGAWFESLVLFGEAERTAQLLGIPRSQTIAAARRAELLIRLGDDERAVESLERAGRRLADVDKDERPRIRATVASARGFYHRRREEFELGLAAHQEEIELLDASPSTPYAVWVSAQTFRITCAFHLPGADRRALIEELRALGDDERLSPVWRQALERDVASLDLDWKSDQGLDEGVEAGKALFAHLSETLSGSTLVRRLSRLADRFREWGEREWAHRILDRAARETMDRLVEVIRLGDELATILQPTPEDLEILRAFRQRLLIEQNEHFDAFVSLWKEGGVNLEGVLDDGLTRVCAWCRRFQSPAAAWIPLADFLPHENEFSASHTICPDCEQEHFQLPPVTS